MHFPSISLSMVWGKCETWVI